MDFPLGARRRIMENRLFKINDYAKEDEKAALKTVIKDTEKSCTVVWVVKPGQSVKCHKHPNADDIWIVIEGEGQFHPEVGKDVLVKAGDIIVNKPGDCHGVTNNSDKDFKFLGVLTPIPAQYEALE